MEDKRKQLEEALKLIQNEDTLDRILNMVKEEVAVYKTNTTWDSLPVWQQNQINTGIVQADNNEGISFTDFKKALNRM